MGKQAPLNDKQKKTEGVQEKKREDSLVQSVLVHLSELRSRLIRSVLVIVVATIALLPFSNELYIWLADPLMRSLADQGGIMIATQVASPFLTPFKLSILSSILISMPFLFYQLWSFVAPGLYKHEKKIAIPLLLMSIVLFFSGIAFAYFVVFPVMFAFLIGSGPEGVQVSTDIALYLDFTLKLFFAFGIAFQVPVITIILVMSDLVEARNLSQKRPYIIVFSFVFGMLLTPPDVISQALLAIPIWILFELGLLVAHWLKRKTKSIEPPTTMDS